MRAIIKVILISAILGFGRFAFCEMPHQLGVGVVLGTTTGFTFKYIRDQKIAYDGTLGWGDSDNYRLSGDMLWQKPRIFLVNQEPFDGYYGLGARIRDRGNYSSNSNNNGVEFGPRAVGGVRYMFHNPRIEAFGELGLVMDIIPATNADLEVGLGGRYYF